MPVFVVFEVLKDGLGENALRKLISVAVKKFKLFDEGQGGLAILKFSTQSLRGQPR